MRESEQSGPVALPNGLTGWMETQGPKVWHAFARDVEFDDPRATIDVLLAAHWIARQPDMDRATGLLLLAHALQAGLHISAPPAMDDTAARAFCIDLHQRLSLSQTEARLPIAPEDHAAIDALSHAVATLPLPAAALKRGTLPSAYSFHANRPHLIAADLRCAA